MASSFTNTFTGKDTGVVLPSGEGVQRAQQGLNAMITQAEEIRYKTWKDNRDQFLKNASIDPVFVLSDSARKSQMSLINNFNKKWGKRAQETNYNFSDQDRQDMLTEKNFIISEAQNQKAQMDRFLQHRDLVAKDTQGMTFDAEAFAREADNYMQTGIYNLSRPPIKALDPSSYLSSLASKETGEYMMGDKSDQITLPSGQVAYRSYNIDPKNIGGWLESRLLGMPEQYQLGMVQAWSELAPTEKEKWLNMADTNQDKKIDAGEKKNAILEWAKDRYSKEVLKPNITTPKGVAKSTTENEVNIGGGKVKINPGAMREGSVPYGGNVYDRPFAFNSPSAIINVPVSGAMRLKGTTTTPLVRDKGSIRAQILEYDPDKDVLVVRSIASNNALGLESQDVLEVPANNVEGINNIPIVINGRKTNISELRQGKTSITPAKAQTVTNVGSIFK